MLVTIALACTACGSTSSDPGARNAGGEGGAPVGAGGQAGSAGAEPTSHGIRLGSACPKDGAKGSFSGAWSRQIPVVRPQSFELYIPPGGNVGALQLVLHSKSAERARLELAVEGPLARLVSARVLYPEQDTLTVFVAPDRTYTLRLSEPDFNGNGADFTVDWQYTPLADCNEPNDTVWTANHVSLGDTIEGYAMAGAVSQLVPIAATQDWFWVTLPTSGSLTVTVEQPPPGTLDIHVWNDTGEVELTSSRMPPTQIVAQELPAGSYAFDVSANLTWPASPIETTGDWRQMPQAVPYRLSLSFEVTSPSSKVTDKLGIDQGEPPSSCVDDSRCGARRTCVEGRCYDPRMPPASGLPCKTDPQCRFDDVCENGLCATPENCQTNDDCAAGRTCAAGRCLLGTFRPCKDNSVCGPGTGCKDGTCQPNNGCGVGYDCRLGQRCNDGTCDDVPVCFDDSTCNSGEHCVAGECEAKGACAASCTSGNFCVAGGCEAGTIGKPCTSNTECRHNAGYCDSLFTESCRRLCQTEEDCQQMSEYAYAKAFGRSYVCREAINAYGVRQGECQATCESEIECPLGQSCSGVNGTGKFCAYPNVAPW